MRADGVRTVEGLRVRCQIDEDTGCWRYAGSHHGNDYPSIWNPYTASRTGAGVLLHWLVHGCAVPAGKVYFARCGTAWCMNPEHRRVGTRSQQMKAHGLRRSMSTKLLISREKRKLSDAEVAAIRSADGRLAEIAARYGISANYACSIRSGKARRLAAASVFEWRP